MSRPRHYVPEIRRFLITVLYHEAQHQGLPMTRLINQILERALADSVGWQKATQAAALQTTPALVLTDK